MMLFVICTILSLAVPALSRQSESERVGAWRANGNKWPPKWQNESQPKRVAMIEREQEILAIPELGERWENYLQFTQSRLVPNFTEVGFEVVQTPPHLQARLLTAVENGLSKFDNLRSEGKIDVIFNERHKEPKFIDIGKLSRDVLLELTEMHEQWGGVEVVGTSAYGVRLYQNESTLVMVTLL